MRIVIIGGGPGGYEAALVAAGHGQDVTLVSNEGLGGNSVLWDCVPSKALIVSAEAMGWMQSAQRLGVRLHSDPASLNPAVTDPASGPAGPAGGTVDLASGTEVSMPAVMDRVQGLAFNQSADISKKIAGAGVRVVEGSARLSGQSRVEVRQAGGSTSTLPADVVLIATGSAPRLLSFSTPDGDRVFTSRELYDLRECPERLIVVGSGATGAEYAHAFARFGADVQLISSREQILPSEDHDAAAVIEDSFERWGTTIHRKKRAVDLERSRDGVRIKVGDDEWIEGSHALFCIGQVPNSRDLGLDSAGVTVADNHSIPVDGVSRTNVPTVYAAGDVTGGTMLASVAAMQGRNAMWHALGEAVAPLRRDAIARCIFTEPEVATVGSTASETTDRHMPSESVTLPLAGNPRAKMGEHTEGFVKIHALAGSGTVLAGTVVSARASDLITPLSVAVHNRLTVSQLAYTSTIYPSMAGSIQEAARLCMARLGDW